MHWSWLATLYSVPNKSYQLQMVWEIWSNYHFTLTCYIQKEYRFKNKTWNKQVNKHSKYNKIAIKTDEMHVGQCFSRYKCIHVYTKHNSNFNQSLSLQHAYVYLLFCVICIHLTNSTNKTFQHVGTKKIQKISNSMHPGELFSMQWSYMNSIQSLVFGLVLFFRIGYFAYFHK